MHRTESIIHINKDNLTIKNKNIDENNPEFEDKKIHTKRNIQGTTMQTIRHLQ